MKKAIGPMIVIILLTFIGCYLIITEYSRTGSSTGTAEILAEDASSENAADIEKVEEDSEKMSTSVTVVLLDKDTDAKTLTVRLVTGGREQVLPYDGTTAIMNRHGDSLSMAQLEIGEILDIVYSTHSKKLGTIQISSNTWTNTGITKFSVNEKKKVIEIAGELYQFTDDLVINSNGEAAQLMDITELDTLTIKGYNRKICSIIIEKGHGYVRLLNDAYFVGGLIEVGQAVIKPITSEMLLPVPEGSYTVRLTNKGYAGEEKIKIERDKETEIDLSKIEVEEVAIGHIYFNIIPDFAQLYVDNEITDFEERVPLEYGIHRIRVEAAGYETVETNIKVGSEYASVEVTLDEETDDSSSSSSSSSTQSTSSSSSSTGLSTTINGTVYSVNPVGTSSTNTSSNSSTSTSSSSTSTTNTSSSSTVVSGEKKIYVEGPSGAEVYLDGNYIGIAPVSTSKVTGSHVLTLSKSGYQTKSYTVNIENDENDVTFSFSELVTE